MWSERVARGVERFLIGVAFFVVLVAAGVVEAHPYQNYTGGPLCPTIQSPPFTGYWCGQIYQESDGSICCNSWRAPPEPGSHSHSSGQTKTETEMDVGCNPFATRDILKARATAKLENEGYEVLDCDPHENFGQVYFLPNVHRWIRGNPENLGACDSTYSVTGGGLSNQGPEWRLVEVCLGER